MRISDWSSDVCSSDLCEKAAIDLAKKARPRLNPGRTDRSIRSGISPGRSEFKPQSRIIFRLPVRHRAQRSEERCVGKVCVSTWRYRWARYNLKKKIDSIRVYSRISRNKQKHKD